MTKKNVFAEWVDRYSNDPVLFVKEVLGVDPDPWQEKFLAAVARGDRKISVRSGHGVGKSTASSWAMLWFFMTRSPVKVVVTAPTSAQLFDAMFAELKRWVGMMPKPLQELVSVKQDRIVFNAAPDEMFISARTSRAEQPEALQGIHCFQHGTVDVLTSTGWVALEHVSLLDKVLCREVYAEKSDFLNPLSVFEKNYEGKMYQHHGRFLDFSVTPGHKFEYEHRQCNKLVSGCTERWNSFVREAKDMHKGINKIKSTFDLDSQVEISSFTIPAYQPRYKRKFDEQPALDIAGDDWVEFLAWYLAEGSICHSKYGPSGVSIAQSQKSNQEKYQRIVALINRMGFEPSQGKTGISINRVQVAEFVKQVCPGFSHQKRIPDFLFGLSKRQIRIFLDAYRAGDGYGDYTYITSSEGMSNDLQRLILLSGGYATINTRSVKGTTLEIDGRTGVRNHDVYKVKEWSARSIGHVTMAVKNCTQLTTLDWFRA